MKSIATVKGTTRNERWTNTVKSSTNQLRQILIQQDFGGTINKRNNSKGTAKKRQEPSSFLSNNNRRTTLKSEKDNGGRCYNDNATLLSKPLRQPSINGNSISSLSSISSISTVGGSRSKNNLLRLYTNNVGSANSFGSISNQNRWKSTAPPSKVPLPSSLAAPVQLRSRISKTKLIGTTSNGSINSLTGTNSSGIRIHHQRRRWLATEANEQTCGGDRPIGTIQRKSSYQESI